MKRFLSMLMVSAGILVLAGCGGDDTTKALGNSKEKVDLRISTGLPDTHQWMLGYFNPMLEEIKELSGDKLDYTLFTSGELVATREELDALNSGTIDVAIPLHPIYDPERFPLSEITMLPILESDVQIATEAFNNLFKDDVVLTNGKTYEEYVYVDKGIKVFPMVSTFPYVISTTKSEINSLDDLKGLKLRSGARVHDLFTKNIGASPISLPFTDLYDGLSKGTLDGALLAVPDWTSYGLEKLFNYTIEGLNLGHYSALTTMTMKTWDSLPSEVQSAFEEATQNQLQAGVDNWIKVNENVRETSTGKYVNVSELEPELQTKLEDAIAKTWTDWIKTVEAAGHPAKEAAIIWRDLIVEAGGKVPDAVMDIK
ncbi:TRAP transporter substrate-binding protein DctP [Solibacillus sp. FSL W8-0474]|uniref:TRAP transporter substrate-binding protein n=1 Tax=Solibacillus sp. FSL W8-0474 TaxID=2975336 RepID=UPI0030FACA4D